MNWKFWKRTIIKVECIKIKKPKKDEMLIFTFPGHVKPEILEEFKRYLERAEGNSTQKYLIINGEICIDRCNRPKINNWQIEFGD